MDKVLLAEDFFKRKKISSSIIGVDKAILSELKRAGIYYASELLKMSKTKELRKDLSQKTGIPYETILYLTKCCDLLRLTGVSGKTLQYLYDTGYDSVEKVKQSSPHVLSEIIKYYMKQLGLKSGMPSCCNIEEVVRLAKLMPEVVKYDD